MNNHSEIEARLAMYAELTGDERQAVDQHMQECEPCAAKLRAYQQMDRSLAGLMASRVQVANRRSIALPRVLVPEAQRHRAPVWWAALQFRARRGVQRWQPVMVSAVGMVVVAFFCYTYVTYLPDSFPLCRKVSKLQLSRIRNRHKQV